MNRLPAFLIALCVALLAMPAVAAARPNILLILTDDQGYGDLALHGNPHVRTPHLDALGRESVRFDRFYVSSVCAPTRAGLLTGRWPLRTGVYGVTGGKEVLRPQEVTLAEALRAGGWRTGCFGKWHNGEQFPRTAQGQGFDDFFGFNGGHWNNYFDTTLLRGTAPETAPGFITDALTAEAMKFIRANATRPFFCYVPFNAPHGPYQVPDKYFDRLKALGLDDKVAAFLGMVENMDDNVGRMLALLDELKLADNTIVLFLTDNGGTAGVPLFNAGMRGGKTSIHEGGSRVPLFIRWPAAKWPSRVVPQLAAHIDLFPTLLDLCAVTPSQGPKLDGLSLRPLLEGRDDASWPDRVLFNHNARDEQNKFPGAVRTPTHRLVCETAAAGNAAPRWQLYDMTTDPGQQRDIATIEPWVVTRLAALYDAWFDDVARERGKPMPVPVGHAQQNPVQIFAPQAASTGGLRYASGPGFSNDWLTGWTNSADTVAFDLDVARSGHYAVTLGYVCPAADAGAAIRVTIGAQSREATVKGTPVEFEKIPHREPGGFERNRNLRWATLDIGEFNLRTGTTRLAISALTKPGAQVMELKHVELRRVD